MRGDDGELESRLGSSPSFGRRSNKRDHRIGQGRQSEEYNEMRTSDVLEIIFCGRPLGLRSLRWIHQEAELGHRCRGRFRKLEGVQQR
jgi:hypothetical protein